MMSRFTLFIYCVLLLVTEIDITKAIEDLSASPPDTTVNALPNDTNDTIETEQHFARSVKKLTYLTGMGLLKLGRDFKLVDDDMETSDGFMNDEINLYHLMMAVERIIGTQVNFGSYETTQMGTHDDYDLGTDDDFDF